MNKIPAGHDYGNSESDLTLMANGKAVSTSMPTIEATISQDRFNSLSEKSMSLNSVIIQMAGDDTAYVVGEEVLVQELPGMSHRGNISRYYQTPSIRALIGNACRLIEDRRFGLLVTTGVPVGTYIKDPTIKDLIKQRLTNSYACEVSYMRDGELVTEPRVVDVEVALVVMEGAGVVLAHGDGGDVKQAVIDIGGGTCDIYAANGQRPLIEKCRSANLGVEASITLLKENFFRIHKRELQQREARAMMMAYLGVQPFPRLSVRGREVKHSEQTFLIEEAIRIIGKQVQSFVASTLNEGETSDSVASSIAKVMVIGRGSLFYLPYLEEIISPEQLKRVDNPGSANSYGYATFSRKRLAKISGVIAS